MALEKSITATIFILPPCEGAYIHKEKIMEWEMTYRLVLLSHPEVAGRTAVSPELAKLVPGDLTDYRHERIGLEQTDWVEDYGKPKIRRTVLIEAESVPGEWELGA